jgi:hypothetical protein
MKFLESVKWSELIFDWHDLDGKQLDMIVTSNDEGYVVWGHDRKK